MLYDLILGLAYLPASCALVGKRRSTLSLLLQLHTTFDWGASAAVARTGASAGTNQFLCFAWYGCDASRCSGTNAGAGALTQGSCCRHAAAAVQTSHNAECVSYCCRSLCTALGQVRWI